MLKLGSHLNKKYSATVVQQSRNNNFVYGSKVSSQQTGCYLKRPKNRTFSILATMLHNSATVVAG